VLPGGRAYAVEAGQQIERLGLTVRKPHADALLVLLDLAGRDPKNNLRAGALRSAEKYLVQLQSRQRAKRRQPVAAEEELVLDDQPPAGVEQKHAVIAKAGCEYLVENAKRIVNPQRIGGLPEADTRDVKGRPALDEQNLHPAPGETCCSRKSADAGSDHENTSNIAHAQPIPPCRSGILQHKSRPHAPAGCAEGAHVLRSQQIR
jgi:hypothetical protein